MFEVAEYIGIIAAAMSGFFVATRNQLDLLGVLIAMFLTSLGGGLLRDIAVDRTPFAFTYNYPAIIILFVLVVMIAFKLHKNNSIENKPFFILSDSIGLISFSITGALIAIEHHLNLTGVMALSFITAVGGGIARDVIINEVPFVFKTGFYGTISLLVGISIYILDKFTFISFVSIAIVLIGGVFLRMIAYYKKWSIPLN
jgi:uncharacterized membrane protein YeiH